MKYEEYNFEKETFPILVKGSRVLRPWELKLLLNSIEKESNRIKFEALLYTGVRYPEAIHLLEHPSIFKGSTIIMKSSKPKANVPVRYIRLTFEGKRAVQRFIDQKIPLPHYANWRKDLIRWARNAGLESGGFGTKTTRKTWESWLTYTYVDRRDEVTLSQGHDRLTSLNHYLGLPYSKQDKEDMIPFVENWI